MIHDQLKQAMVQAVHRLCEAYAVVKPDTLQVIVEHPANTMHGDYSLNVAMQLARIFRKAPLQIAEELCQHLRQDDTVQAFAANVEVAPPGFINVYIDWHKWASRYAGQQKQAASESAKKVIIEHTSINPNKSAHIGHLRNSVIGDTLARMLSWSGHQVEVHNYIDDLGNQLADTVVGIQHIASDQSHERFGDFCWDTYALVNRAYRETPQLEQERANVLHALEAGNNNTAWLGLLVAERIVREHVEEMKQFRIGYDVLVWESRIVAEGFWEQTFELLRKTQLFHKETAGKLAGCWVLKQGSQEASETANEPASDEHAVDKVLVRSNGILTYTAKDIAYHLWKFGVLDRDFTYSKFAEKLWSTAVSGVKKKFGHAEIVINVIDYRQSYPQEMVKQALQALGYEEQAQHLHHVGYGVVSLSSNTAAGLGVDTSDGKASYPMSGRQGIGVKVADFLSQMEKVIDAKRSRRAGIASRAIAAAAIRYYLLRFNLQTEVVFDLDQASEISGNTGIYVIYAYARSCSILNRGEGSFEFIPATTAFAALEKSETALMRQLAYGPELLDQAIRELAPNQLCTYLFELATCFNHFYATCPIMKAEGEQRQLRLWLTAQFQSMMKVGLELLGLPAPAKM